jgi:hypothetical protein
MQVQRISGFLDGICVVDEVLPVERFTFFLCLIAIALSTSDDDEYSIFLDPDQYINPVPSW